MKLANPNKRATEEWHGSSPDAEIPARVKLRIWTRCDGKCALTGKRIMPGDAYDFDHIKALANGGTHSEGNLQLVWREAHKAKTAADRGEQARVERIRKKHLGIWEKPKGNNRLQSRPFPKRWEAK